MNRGKKYSYDPDLNEKVMERLNSQADLAVLKRCVPTIPMYFALFVAIVWATPIYSRYPKCILGFGSFLFVLSALRFWLAIAWEKIYSKQDIALRRFFNLSHFLTSASWGAFCCFTITGFELGWTSFFVLIMTVGICSVTIPSLAPKFSFFTWHLILMLLPSLGAMLFYVSGLKGEALAAFFGGFFILLLIQAKVQNIEYWDAIRNHTRLQAMIDVVPGTLSWVSSDLKYLGVNQNLSHPWNLSPDSFIGKKIGFVDSRTEMKEFIEELFASQEHQLAKELTLKMGDEPKVYYIVGNKYHHDTEAVILGLDITDYKKALQELGRR